MSKGKILCIAMTLMLLAAAGKAFAADARVTANGTFFFTNPETGQMVGIRHARIEMCDEDGFPFGCTVFATGETGADGRFSLSGISGDWFGDLPEVEVRIYATSAGAEVSDGMSVYCFKTRRVENAAYGSRIDFGYVTPDSGFKCTFGGSAAGENGAWAAYQWSREAYDFLRGSSSPYVFSGLAASGQGVERQKVKWPAASSIIYADLSGFDLKRGDEAEAVKVITMYTASVMSRRLGSIGLSWDAGFARAFGFFIARDRGHRWNRLCSSTDPSFCGTPEDPPHASHAIGGMSREMASIGTYWDLYDGYPDGSNHDGNASADNMHLSLDLLWDNMLDPTPGDGIDDSPYDLAEYGRALILRLPGSVLDIRDVYDENHVPQP